MTTSVKAKFAMTVRNSTRTHKARKPYSSFPLWSNSNGQWSKKIRGKVYCFGRWDKPQEALVRYKAERRFLESGIRPKIDGWSVKNAIDYFLDRLQTDVDDGEKSQRHFDDCLRTGKIIVSVFDKHRQTADLDGSDFYELRRIFNRKKNGKTASPDTRDGHVRRTMAIFNRCINDGKVDRVVFGADFRKKSKRDKSIQAASSEAKFIDAGDIRTLIDNSHYRLKAMILLAVNCGLGNNDIAKLRFDQLDLVDGWLENDRSKTGERRCASLWMETLNALETIIERRFEPEDKTHNDLVFITRYKKPFSNPTAITNEFRKLKTATGIEAGGSFYTLRHVCRTIAEECSDDSATKWIMGHHRTDSIDSRYIHRPPKVRIEQVCNHVHDWLFAEDNA